MKHAWLLAGLVVAVAGCNGAATRAWQRADLPTHDRQRAFEAAQEVLEKHFKIARANYTEGTIETRPQSFDRKKAGTLADLRGAGGQWRRTVSVELDRDGLTIVARAAVRLEREATAAAVAASEAAQPADAADHEVPRAAPLQTRRDTGAGREVWVEVGYDNNMAQEILAQIAERVRQEEQSESVPQGQSPQQAAEESRRLGEQQGR